MCGKAKNLFRVGYGYSFLEQATVSDHHYCNKNGLHTNYMLYMTIK